MGTSRRLDALWMSGTWLQILPRPGWSGYMSKMRSSNTEYSTSAVLPLPFVNNVSNQPVDDVFSICGGTTKQMWTVSHHCHLRPTTLRKGKRNGPWLRGPIVLFPASSFDSEDSTSCFPSWARSVSLWAEVDWKRCGRPYMRRTVSFT